MGKKLDIVTSLKFRSYAFKVIACVLGILNAYHIISNDKINLFYILAFVVTALAGTDIKDASDHISEIQSKEPDDSNSQR